MKKTNRNKTSRRNFISPRYARAGLLATFVALVVMGATSIHSPVSAEEPNNSGKNIGYERVYVLGSGDKVRVNVFGHKDISGEFEISGDGAISMPLIQSISAAGLTASDLEQVIIDRLQPDFLKNPKVTVEVLNYRPFYILGEVKSPGSYAYVNGITIKQAVALAGGYTYRAKKSTISITRTDDRIEKKFEVNEDALVLPGDIIDIPERYF